MQRQRNDMPIRSQRHRRDTAGQFPDDTGGRPRQALELTLCGRGDVGAVLLDLQLGPDADLFEEALHQLRVIDEVSSEAAGHRALRLKALREAGFR